MDRAVEVALRGIGLTTMLTVMAAARLILRTGEGSKVTGLVAGRTEEEDVETQLDRTAHELYVGMAETIHQQLGLKVALYSEHGITDDSTADLYLLTDPIGGTTYALHGHHESVWTVWGILDAATMEPILGGAADARHGEFLLTYDDGVRLTSLDWATGDSGLNTLLTPSRKTELDNSVILSGYMGDFKYSLPFMELIRPIAERASLTKGDPSFLRPFVWHAGGESTGPYLARGDNGGVHFYASAWEPRNEVDVWLPFAAATGSFVGMVTANKHVEPYEGFSPSLFAEGRIPIFVAAVTRQLAEACVWEMPAETVRHIHDNPPR